MLNKKALFFILLAICFFFIYFLFHSPCSSTEVSFPQKMEIQKNQSVSKVIENLHKRKLISSPFLFKLYIKLKGLDRHIKHGQYQISKSSSISELTQIFLKGNIETVSLTFYEGISSWKIFSILKQKMSLDSIYLEKLLIDSSFIKELNLSSISLEGFLYPETYLFPVKSTEKEILKIMVQQWKKVFYSLPYQNSLLFQKYGLIKIMVMSSITQKEATVSHELKRISGVFWNRYKQNWSLGADPTIRYSLRKLTQPLTTSDLRSNNSYNTRRFKGLPPSPISNPGKQSIIATLFPEKHNYMFFVAKDNGSKEHYFSKTNEEHNLLKRKRYHNRLSN